MSPAHLSGLAAFYLIMTTRFTDYHALKLGLCIFTALFYIGHSAWEWRRCTVSSVFFFVMFLIWSSVCLLRLEMDYGVHILPLDKATPGHLKYSWDR